jgi:hypothetical protein
MNKPLSMVVEETKKRLASICNESGLPPVILDLILHGIYNEVHNLAEKQSLYDKNVYEESLKNELEN